MARKGILWAVAPQEAILAIHAPLFTERVFAHHVTLAFGVTEEEVAEHIGKRFTGAVTAMAWNNDIQALRVELPADIAPLCGNNDPHITVSSNGVPPVKSNDMLAGEHGFILYPNPKQLDMVIEWSPFK